MKRVQYRSGGYAYKVVDETETDVAVHIYMDYWNPFGDPKRKRLLLWWSKTCVKEIVA